jgi:hypothetical protein
VVELVEKADMRAAAAFLQVLLEAVPYRIHTVLTDKVFGYVGRPANGAISLASVPDISADWQATRSVALNFYYAYAQGKTVVGAIYPTGGRAPRGCDVGRGCCSSGSIRLAWGF